MKTIRKLVIVTLAMMLTPVAQAASDTEFGERFTNQTPAAFEHNDQGDLLAAEFLNQIAPAAGELSGGDEPSNDNNAPEATSLQGNDDQATTNQEAAPGLLWEDSQH